MTYSRVERIWHKFLWKSPPGRYHRDIPERKGSNKWKWHRYKVNGREKRHFDSYAKKMELLPELCMWFRQMGPGGYFMFCRFITIMHTCLKVPAKNSPALLFLSRGKEEERKKQQSAALPLLRKSRAGEFLAGTFKHVCMMVIKRQDVK